MKRKIISGLLSIVLSLTGCSRLDNKANTLIGIPKDVSNVLHEGTTTLVVGLEINGEQKLISSQAYPSNSTNIVELSSLIYSEIIDNDPAPIKFTGYRKNNKFYITGVEFDGEYIKIRTKHLNP